MGHRRVEARRPVEEVAEYRGSAGAGHRRGPHRVPAFGGRPIEPRDGGRGLPAGRRMARSRVSAALPEAAGRRQRARVPRPEAPAAAWFSIRRMVAELERSQRDWVGDLTGGYFCQPSAAWER